jgi:hypothetical protein
MDNGLIEIALTMFKCTEVIVGVLLFISIPLWTLAILKIIEYSEK